jgi:hypothetical protein
MVHHTQDPPPIISNASLPPVILPDGASMVMIDPDLVSGDTPDPELDSEESQLMDSADPEETGTFSFEVPESNFLVDKEMGILMPTFELHDDNTKGIACHMFFNQPILEQDGDVDSFRPLRNLIRTKPDGL